MGGTRCWQLRQLQRSCGTGAHAKCHTHSTHRNSCKGISTHVDGAMECNTNVDVEHSNISTRPQHTPATMDNAQCGVTSRPVPMTSPRNPSTPPPLASHLMGRAARMKRCKSGLSTVPSAQRAPTTTPLKYNKDREQRTKEKGKQNKTKTPREQTSRDQRPITPHSRRGAYKCVRTRHLHLLQHVYPRASLGSVVPQQKNAMLVPTEQRNKEGEGGETQQEQMCARASAQVRCETETIQNGQVQGLQITDPLMNVHPTARTSSCE